MLAFEHARLLKAGQKVLADRARHVSQTKGDGLGCDVPGCNMRFDASGKERFIEVKTTSFGKETPFFISRNEVEFSGSNDAYFHPQFSFPGCSKSARARACSISPGWLRATACSIRFPTLGGSRKREKRLKPLVGAVLTLPLATSSPSVAASARPATNFLAACGRYAQRRPLPKDRHRVDAERRRREMSK